MKREITSPLRSPDPHVRWAYFPGSAGVPLADTAPPANTRSVHGTSSVSPAHTTRRSGVPPAHAPSGTLKKPQVPRPPPLRVTYPQSSETAVPRQYSHIHLSRRNLGRILPPKVKNLPRRRALRRPTTRSHWSPRLQRMAAAQQRTSWRPSLLPRPRPLPNPRRRKPPRLKKRPQPWKPFPCRSRKRASFPF